MSTNDVLVLLSVVLALVVVGVLAAALIEVRRGLGRISEGLAVLRQVELIAPHLDWIAREAPAAILRGERPEPPF